MSEQKRSSHEQKHSTQKENLDNSVRRMSGKTEKAVMKKGNRPCIVDTQDGRNKPYFNVLIGGKDGFASSQWQLVHQDNYKLIKKTGKIGNIPMAALRIKK